MQKTDLITNEEILFQLSAIKESLEIKEKNNKKEKAKQKGHFELKNDGTVRLQYCYKGTRYYDRKKASSEKEARQLLAEFVKECENGDYSNSNYTFAEFAQVWLDKKVRPNADENRCVQKYIGALNKRILPYLGKIKLKNINKRQLEDYFNMIKNTKTEYKNRENHRVKPAAVDKWRMIINAVLNYAVSCELIEKNPCKSIKIKYTNTQDLNYIKDLVKKQNEKISYYDIETYKKVCSLLENEFNQYYYDDTISSDKKLRECARRFLLLLDLKTGMRRSELFGLARNSEYNDLDIDNATFSVNKSRHYAKNVGKYTKPPKNESSIRTKSLPKSILNYLKLYYDLLDKANYKNMYIFDFLSIDGICSWFSKWQDANNINKIRFHDIRHTHATILLGVGTDMKTISERLGHNDIQTTFNIYADVLKELDQNASDKIDRI